jgi:hypothetical protein
MFLRIRPSAALAAFLITFAAVPAFAQYQQPGKKQSQQPQQKQSPPQTTQQQNPQQPVRPTNLIQRINPHDWTLTVTVIVNAFQEQYATDHSPAIEYFDFETAAVVFPVIKDTAASQTNDSRFKGSLYFDGRLSDESPKFLPDPYPSGTRLAKWQIADKRGRSVKLNVEIAMTCWQTKFDEKAAAAVGWPKGPFPPAAASTLEPQNYIDRSPDGKPYDMKPVKDLLNRLTDGRSPKSQAPVALAKWIAGEVVRGIQPSGAGLRSARTGQLEGIDLQGAPQTAERSRGSEFDIVCLLAALYRQAGLPARTVIGWDTGDSTGSGDTFLKNTDQQRLRAWVEFALYDEASKTLTWVPVDVARIRNSSTRPPSIDQPWPYFGSHDRLDGVIPFAFQFHPPTTVLAYGSPGFWGWLVTPEPPKHAWQSLTFMAITTPKTSQDQIRDRERRKGQ